MLSPTYFMIQLRRIALAALVLAAIVVPASGAPLSYTGNFVNDNDVVLIPFTLSDFSLVGFRTFGYGGGVNGAGQVILPGGFESMLQLFELPSGAAVGGSMFPGTAPNSCSAGPQIPDPNRFGFCFDVFSQLWLNAGDYILALTQNDNETAGSKLSDGFIYDAVPDFANGFQGLLGTQGDSHWALDITVSPEPGAALLIAPALLLLGVMRRRRAN